MAVSPALASMSSPLPNNIAAGNVVAAATNANAVRDTDSSAYSSFHQPLQPYSSSPVVGGMPDNSYYQPPQKLHAVSHAMSPPLSHPSLPTLSTNLPSPHGHNTMSSHTAQHAPITPSTSYKSLPTTASASPTSSEPGMDPALALLDLKPPTGRVSEHEKQYFCPTCHAGFTQKGSLTKHRLIHQADPKLAKPFKCTHPGCSRAFTQSGNLKRHARAHANIKEYQCSFCYKAFARRDTCRSHEQTHTKDQQSQQQQQSLDHSAATKQSSPSPTSAHSQSQSYTASLNGQSSSASAPLPNLSSLNGYSSLPSAQQHTSINDTVSAYHLTNSSTQSYQPRPPQHSSYSHESASQSAYTTDNRWQPSSSTTVNQPYNVTPPRQSLNDDYYSSNQPPFLSSPAQLHASPPSLPMNSAPHTYETS